MAKNILPDARQTFDYYKNYVPLSLQNSYGFLSHFKLWYDSLCNPDEKDVAVLGVSNYILNLLDIMQANYVNGVLNPLKSSVADTSDFLDKLGGVVGAKRQVIINNEQLSLTDDELLLYIKCKILQKRSNGTYEEIAKLYKDAGINVFSVSDDEHPATCKMFLGYDDVNYPVSQNIRKLFTAGEINIHNLGISYVYSVIALSGFLLWDSTNTNELWDKGVWLV